MSLLIRLLEITEEPLALRYHLEKSAAGVKILLVLLQMGRESLDLFRKKGNLVFRRTRVLLMPFYLSRHSVLLLMRQRHTFVSAGFAFQRRPAQARK